VPEQGRAANLTRSEAFTVCSFSSLTIENAGDNVVRVVNGQTTKQRDRIFVMTVAAAVVGNRGTMSTTGALVEMPAQRRGATTRNGQQQLDVLPTDPLAVSLDEGRSRVANQIGNLQQRPGH
jgi:hypothetical protein